jgi:hypothetical protein
VGHMADAPGAAVVLGTAVVALGPVPLVGSWLGAAVLDSAAVLDTAAVLDDAVAPDGEPALGSELCGGALEAAVPGLSGCPQAAHRTRSPSVCETSDEPE